uniref:Uncharacterized protein n=1 Tax=Kwoniella bestiolae CBS 10118 TaxID=1296100 RepID=A0A1B9GF94_9TREE|nr:hypothetical protein I302_01233 [Kwoniella bestiolae CBS 10118]OCF29720.1 hypothetical protein I302_01233 [Kwoniella bestiolae CBS 10118]
MTYRDSFISTASTDTYPSTMSSLSHSALGLTDAPLRPRLRSTLANSTSSSSVPGTPVRTKAFRPQLRQPPSRSSLHQEATTNAARRVVHQQSNEVLRTIPPKSSQSDLSSNGPPPTSRPVSRNGTAPDPQNTPERPATTPAKPTSRSTPTTQLARPSQPQRAETTQPTLTRATQRPPVQRKPVPVPAFPARTESSLAEEWEAELIKDTRQLNIRPAPTPARQGPSGKEREEQRLKDMEWERSGMWDTTRDPAREAEDRARRDFGRDVAYPPATPRVPVRAAPSGVTSVHIGIRPRLHPTRASDSMVRNQPDPSIPVPLFSPASASPDLPDDFSRSSHNPRYDPALAEKAKKEYEDWKARKAEREGGIADEGENHGTRDWVPKSREVARPGNVEGIAHSDAYEDTHHRMSVQDQMILHQQMQAMQQQAMQMQMAEAAPPVEKQQTPMPKQPAKAPIQAQVQTPEMQGMEGYYPEQGYWDPLYWWGMGGMMSDPQQLAMAQGQDATQEGLSNQAASTPITPEDPYAELAYSMMYNNPYQWGGAQGGNGMMPGGYNPYMMMGGGSQAGSTMNGPTAGGSAAGTISARGGAPSEGGMQAFDSSKMKQGRMGHYGYLEGRELAGPPVGFLPAGVQPEQYDSPAAPSNNQISPSHRAASTAGQSYYTAPPSQGGGGSVNGSMAWGDSGNTPRARYDGSSTAAGYVQADLDTPYPRTNGGGASSAFTRYGPDGSIVNGIDGRMGINHRRLREGRV